MKYKAIDLFSGAGGLTLGLKHAGFSVLAGVEVAPNAVETYRLNHPEVKLYDADVRIVSPEAMLADFQLKSGDLDLLAACPPCQGFSTHRTRNKKHAAHDVRNDLVFEFLRFARAMLPKTILIENVPGLYKDSRLATLKEKLISLGYQFGEHSIAVLNAADYGVPQRRRRMILMASRFGIIDPPAKISEKRTVRDVLQRLPKAGTSGDVLHDWLANRTPRIQKLISLIPRNGGSRSQLPEAYWLECHKRNPNSFSDVYGRMVWDRVAPTITGGCHNPSKGRFLHPEENRAITLREAALLQTFPIDYKFSTKGGKDSVALMIGNALPPVFIERQADEIVEHIQAIEGL